MQIIYIIGALIMGLCIGIIIGRVIEKRVLLFFIEREKSLSKKNLKLFFLTTQWIKNKINGNQIGDLILRLGYKTVAIYGVSYLCELLLDDLESSNITVSYCIDSKVKGTIKNIPIFNPSDILPAVDVIVVTPIFMMAEIELMLKNRVECEIISIEEILFIEK